VKTNEIFAFLFLKIDIITRDMIYFLYHFKELLFITFLKILQPELLISSLHWVVEKTDSKGAGEFIRRERRRENILFSVLSHYHTVS
jgi:hypothetical protein